MTEHAVRLTRLDPTGVDHEALVDFLSTEEFPFHVRRTWNRAEAVEAVDSGAYRDDEHDTYWVDHTEHGRIGVVRFEDLEDPVPLFDLRIAGAFRGRGLGVPTLRAVTDHVFRTLPSATRFEGQTREDNVAMRRVFLHAGWVKEAHYREGWPIAGGRAAGRSLRSATGSCAATGRPARRHRCRGTTTCFLTADGPGS